MVEPWVAVVVAADAARSAVGELGEKEQDGSWEGRLREPGGPRPSSPYPRSASSEIAKHPSELHDVLDRP